MKRFFWLWVLVFSIIAIGCEAVFIYSEFGHTSWTESASNGGQALTGVVALLIFVSFLNERIKTRDDSALEVVKLFISEVNPIHLRISQIKVNQYKDPNFNLPRIQNVESFNVEWMKTNRFNESKAHVEFQAKDENNPLLLENRTLLNHYEYISLFIKQKGIYTHKSISVIREAFVADVEQQAFLISTNRLITAGIYPNLIWLYEKWRMQVDRTTVEEKVRVLFAKP
jgi:hypothetical protein